MLSLLLVSLSLGLDNFAASIGIGLSGVDARVRLKTALAFGFFEALMPVLGLLAGHAVAGPLSRSGQYLGGALLILTGAYVLWPARRDTADAKPAGLPIGHLLALAFALSLDNLIVGFALGLYRVPLLTAAAVIAVVSVAMSLAGLEMGQRLGARFEDWSEELGGALLVLLGVLLATSLLR